MAFSGFPAAAFEFFAGLREHNEPGWFKPRKALYQEAVVVPFREFIVALGAALAAAGVPLIGDPDRGMFRIYRDVRFSPDKRLYKTHAAAVLTRSGGKRNPGLLYVHLEPGGESMAGVGFWHPEPELLARLRRAILADPDGFRAMLARLAAAGLSVITDEKLARLPRGFEAAKGSAVADYLCWKTFIVEVPLADAEMMAPGIVERIAGIAAAALPLLEWGWAAIEDDVPPLALNIPARPLPKPDF